MDGSCSKGTWVAEAVESAFLFKGLILGFSVAAPVGPIGLLCIRRTLASGRATGFVSGLGAAVADSLYGAIAAFGVTWVTSLLLDQKVIFQLVGGAFMCYLGIRTFLAAPSGTLVESQAGGLFGSFASTFLLTISNPMTILSFAAMFTGLGATSGEGLSSSASLVLGVFVGSAIWWLLLSSAAGAVRGKFDTGSMRLVNRLSGAVILAFGVWALASGL